MCYKKHSKRKKHRPKYFDNIKNLRAAMLEIKTRTRFATRLPK
jgi:hypothetical protein